MRQGRVPQGPVRGRGRDLEVSVRPRVAADLEGCATVLAAVHRQDGYPVNWPAEPAGWLSPSTLLAAWVAELDGAVAGHVVLSRSGPDDLAPALWAAEAGAEAGQAAVVNRLFVAPAARGHRIGARLMAEATRAAHDLGLHPVLDVVATDTAAAALYERLGWRLLATTEQRWSPEQTVSVRSYAAPAVPPPD